jgi:dihydropteroate synthase
MSGAPTRGEPADAMAAAARPHIQFITGRLAEASLRRVLEPLAGERQFDYSVAVLPITVAALMTPDWIARHVTVDRRATQVMVPGYCGGELARLREKVGVPVVVGPHDLRDLPQFLGAPARRGEDYGEHALEIIAEINHAPRRSLASIVHEARELSAAGADRIDVGCDPGSVWTGVGDCVRALRDLGLRVSIDSWEPQEIAPAVKAGADLVLSVNQTNRERAPEWGCEVVAIPDDPSDLDSLERTMEFLAGRGVPFRMDPILEPIGFGFGASLLRYATMRQRHADVPMMMGIGNLTELTDVDSLGLNVLLLALCAEWRIGSVLTTQVINWARSSVRECSLARQLVHHAVKHQTLPKHLATDLVVLRDPRLLEVGDEFLAQLAVALKDHNFRIFAERGEIHVVSAGLHLHDADPFRLLDQLLANYRRPLDASHAFYLGYELCKAVTALTLGKQYRQDEALDWGFLTRPERHAHRRDAEDRAGGPIAGK